MPPVKVRRIDFSPDEWIAGTVMLTNGERGLYITACALIYSHGGPIDRQHLRNSCADHGNAFNRQLARLLSLGKLIGNGEEIDQKRCENELEKARKRAENARENGRKHSGNGEEIDRKSSGNGEEKPRKFKINAHENGAKAKENNDVDNQGRGLTRATNYQPSTINHQTPNGVSAPKGRTARGARARPPGSKSPIAKLYEGFYAAEQASLDRTVDRPPDGPLLDRR